MFFLFCSVISDRYLMWSAVFKIPTLHREGGFLWSAWPWVQVNNLHTLPLQIISLMHSEEKHGILVKRMDSDRRCGRICSHGNALKASWQLLTSSELFLLFEVSLFLFFNLHWVQIPFIQAEQQQGCSRVEAVEHCSNLQVWKQFALLRVWPLRLIGGWWHRWLQLLVSPELGLWTMFVLLEPFGEFLMTSCDQ